MAYYGTLAGANTYFANRLHSDSWAKSAPTDRPKALLEATRIIDSLSYRGVKHSVWSIMYEYDAATKREEKILVNPPSRDEIIVADATQELEFPRGKDTAVPQEIEWACYEIAIALIDGFDQEDAIDRLRVTQQTYAAVRTTYANDVAAMEYLVYGIPTARVWRWLVPFLKLDGLIKISRAD
jgi:hypothetical protein